MYYRILKDFNLPMRRFKAGQVVSSDEAKDVPGLLDALEKAGVIEPNVVKPPKMPSSKPRIVFGKMT